jgi:hypothetical protein
MIDAQTPAKAAKTSRAASVSERVPPQDPPASRLYLPLNAGFRFSANARSASSRSSLRTVSS